VATAVGVVAASAMITVSPPVAEHDRFANPTMTTTAASLLVISLHLCSFADSDVRRSRTILSTSATKHQGQTSWLLDLE
jgi:hypothetical protein